MTNLRKILGAVALTLVLVTPARAQTPLADAIAADPTQAEAMVAGQDALTRDLLIWSQQRKGVGSPVRAAGLLERRPDWPAADRLRREAEGLISARTPARDVLALLEETGPRTGRGALALARAQAQTDPDAAQATVIAAWRNLSLTADEETAFLVDQAALLADHHVARTDALLARDDTGAAARMIDRLPPPQRALMAARLAYATGAGVEAAVAGLPDGLRGDPGLQQARFAWLARQGRRDEAARLLARQSAQPGGLGDPAAWSGWRRRLVRDALAGGQDLLAYDLAAQHHLTPEASAGFADLEWLAGYIALRRLAAPETAAHHFATLRAGVSTPISRARAAYWLGRAHDAAGQPDAARAAYAEAARLPFTYYGRLALEELAATAPPVAPVPPAGELPEQARAVLLLLDAGERGAAYLFAESLAAQADPPELAAAAAELNARGDYFYALRIGKGAAARGIILPHALFPPHPLGAEPLPDDPALALAIARQESEFRTDAGSPAGALGLMQLMPGTARQMAAAEGLPFEQNRLIRDWRYNAALGSAYLARLRARFGDSPVLIAAGYNAGPGRADDWIGTLGDPRDGSVDPIDWVELIPFSETRNYVMRVTEAIPAYQQQLGLPQSRLHDMLRGAGPIPRPRARPTPPVAPVPAPVGQAAPPEPPTRVLRPRARP